MQKPCVAKKVYTMRLTTVLWWVGAPVSAALLVLGAISESIRVLIIGSVIALGLSILYGYLKMREEIDG